MTIRVPGVGKKPAKIMFVGEHARTDDEQSGIPFSGASGRLFNQVLQRVGINRNETYVTNVLWEVPPSNNLEKLLVNKKELPSWYSYLPVKKNKFLPERFLSELPRLSREISEVDPNVIVAFGTFACWALFAKNKIQDLRGFVHPCSLVPGKKVVAVYPPDYIQGVWRENFSFFNDLKKVKRESLFPEIIVPERKIVIEPSIEYIENWILENKNAEIIACDIETEDEMITCISFAASEVYGVVVPFKDPRKSDGNYWKSSQEEHYVWNLVEKILTLPAKKLFQNGVYDIQHIFLMGLQMVNCTADTMLLHHSLFQELKKSLGFMGSYLCNENAWKLMHKRSGETEEREEEE